MTKPAKISGLKVSVYGYKSLMITWNESEGADEYQVFRSKTGKKNTFKRIKTLSADTTSYRNTGLTCGKTYHYKVRALNEKGSSGLSSAVSRKVRPGNVEINKIKPLPNKQTYRFNPVILRAVGEGHAIRIYWDKVSGATSYQVYRKRTDRNNWSLLKTVSSKYGYATDPLRGKKSKSGVWDCSDLLYDWEYKVRAIRKAGGKTTFGNFSPATEFVPDWTIEPLYEESWKYGESLEWTVNYQVNPEYNEYLERDENLANGVPYLIPRTDGATFNCKHMIGYNPGYESVYTNPEHGCTEIKEGFDLKTEENSSWSVTWGMDPPCLINKYMDYDSLMKNIKTKIDVDLERWVGEDRYYMRDFDYSIGQYYGEEYLECGDEFTIYIKEVANNTWQMFLLIR